MVFGTSLPNKLIDWIDTTRDRLENKLPLIEDRAQTDRVAMVTILNLTYNLDFQSPASYGHHRVYRAKYQGKRSVGWKTRVETNWRTDTTDRIIFPANTIGDQRLV